MAPLNKLSAGWDSSKANPAQLGVRLLRLGITLIRPEPPLKPLVTQDITKTSS